MKEARIITLVHLLEQGPHTYHRLIEKTGYSKGSIERGMRLLRDSEMAVFDSYEPKVGGGSGQLRARWRWHR